MRQNGGSSTAVLEPAELRPMDNQEEALTSKRPSTSGRSLGSKVEPLQIDEDSDRNETLPSPTTVANEELERWNFPRRNVYKVGAAFWALVVAGMNDASYGAIIPYLQTFYGQGYTIISLIFLSPFIGYTMSALLNNAIHLKFGQRGIAILGPGCHLIAYIINAVHPPFPVLVVSFILAGFGNGLEDAAWNAWIGAMDNANEVLGFLHAFYGLGATIAPLIATTMITQGLEWYYWYYCMIGFAAFELVTSVHAFWKEDGPTFRESHSRTSDHQGSRLKEATLRMPAARVTWLCALFFLGYVGVEVALGGWIVECVLRSRS